MSCAYFHSEPHCTKKLCVVGQLKCGGDYELVVADFISREKQGDNRIVDRYDAIVIDPWIGDFIRKNKFENVGHVHEFSASSSGLMETKV